jgi:hypothetical protein
MTDLLTQLRNYGSHLDAAAVRESASEAFMPAGLIPADVIDFAVRSDSVPRRQFLRWSAAAAALAAAGGGAALITRHRETLPAEEGGQPEPIVSGPTDTPLGEWALLDVSSSALTVPPRSDIADANTPDSGMSNSLEIARLSVVSGLLVGVGTLTLDSAYQAMLLTSTDGVAWDRRVIDSANWTMGADVVEFPPGNFVACGSTGTGDETSQPVVWAGPSLDRLTTTLLDVPVGTWMTAGFVRVGDELLLRAGDVNGDAAVRYWRSFDGRAWAELDAELPLGGGITIMRPAAFDGAIVDALAPVPGQGRAIIRSSDGGETWTARQLPSDLPAAVSTFEVMPGGFVAVGSESTQDSVATRAGSGPMVITGTSRLAAWTSPDGSTWTRRPVVGDVEGVMQNWNAVAQGPAGLVGIASELRERDVVKFEVTSSDGQTWQVREVEITGQPSAMVPLANGYLGIGSAGSVWDFDPLSDDDRLGKLSVWFRRDR